MGFNILPKQVDFFDYFNKLAQIAVKAADAFCEIVGIGIFDEETSSKMREIEHEGDEITHTIFKKLNMTFITPFDREDIHELAHKLDGIIDVINTMTNRMRVYRLSGVNDDLVEFASVIAKSVRATAGAIEALRFTKKPQTVYDCCIEVNRLENIGDAMRDTILGKLLESANDPIFIMKWKEVFEDAETVLDVCEEVSNVIESIMVKQA
jgi:predicted phosphate transport protein (TIGR00153 family)